MIDVFTVFFLVFTVGSLGVMIGSFDRKSKEKK